MKTPSIEIDLTRLGTPYTLNMPYPGLFYFESPKTCRFLLMPDAVGDVISKRAAAFGELKDGLLVFPREEAEAYPLRYELLGRIAEDSPNPSVRAGYLEEQALLRALGQMDLPAYFGLYPPPRETPLGPVDALQRVCNGAYFVLAGGRWLLGVAEYAYDMLPDHLEELGAVTVEDYAFFDFSALSPEKQEACAADLVDCWNTAPPVDDALSDRFPLYAGLLRLWSRPERDAPSPCV